MICFRVYSASRRESIINFSNNGVMVPLPKGPIMVKHLLKIAS